jgi:hypothetical protein
VELEPVFQRPEPVKTADSFSGHVTENPEYNKKRTRYSKAVPNQSCRFEELVLRVEVPFIDFGCIIVSAIKCKPQKYSEGNQHKRRNVYFMDGSAHKMSLLVLEFKYTSFQAI